MSRRVLLIHNPAAATGSHGDARIRALMTALRARGCLVQEQVTTAPGHALRLAAERGGTAEVVIAAGGDGTAHEVASGLLEGGHPAALAIAPLGTGNDAAALLGLTSAELVTAAVCSGRTRRLDTIEVTWREGGERHRRNALLFAGVGFATEIIRLTTPAVRRWFGPRLCYPAGFFRALATYRAPRLRVRSEAGEWSQSDAVVALAANAPHAGGRAMQIGPGARMDDGVLELTLIEAVGRWELARQFVRLVRGTHIHHPRVRFFRGQWLEVDADPPMPLAVDGEVYGMTPARFEVKPGSLNVVSA